MKNTIEILLASYNGAAYIREQIDSILAQTYENWLLTISDDGSTDGTDAIIDEYVSKYPDQIRRVLAGRRFGNAKEHFMWLISQCDAEWVMLSDQDDTVKEDKFEKLAALMSEAEKEYGADLPILVFSDQTPTDAQLNPICDSLMKMQNQYTDNIDWRALVFQNIVTGGACMFNQALAKVASRCMDVQKIVMHDWWLAIVAARFGKVVYLDESTGYYRQHGSNSVGAKNVKSLGYVVENLKKLMQVRQSLMKKKMQAEVFARTYAEEMTREDGQFLAGYTKPHSGLLFWWKYRALIHGWQRWLGGWILG